MCLTTQLFSNLVSVFRIFWKILVHDKHSSNKNYKVGISITTAHTQSAEEDHSMWLKALKKLLNGHFWEVFVNFWSLTAKKNENGNLYNQVYVMWKKAQEHLLNGPCPENWKNQENFCFLTVTSQSGNFFHVYFKKNKT